MNKSQKRIVTSRVLTPRVQTPRVQQHPIDLVRVEASPFYQLAGWLNAGRQQHELCRGSFIEIVQTGYWAYERSVTYRTCAVAAAYIGCFGSEALSDSGFSYSMAVWRLGIRLGLDLSKLIVTGPTGRINSVVEEMIYLVDVNYWTRAGVVEYLLYEAMKDGGDYYDR